MIGEGAFHGRISLTSVTIPGRVKKCSRKTDQTAVFYNELPLSCGGVVPFIEMTIRPRSLLPLFSVHEHQKMGGDKT